MTDYRTREDAANAALAPHRATLGATLSTLTGETWTADPQPASDGDSLREETNTRYIGLTRADGLRIGVHVSTYPKLHLESSMSYPRDANDTLVSWRDVAPWDADKGGRTPAPGINVAADATTDRLAKEIARRLLPPIRVVWPAFQRALEATAARKDARAATLAMLAADFGADISRSRNDSGCTVYVGNTRCEVDNGGNVEIHRNLSPERAAAVLKLLATME